MRATSIAITIGAMLTTMPSSVAWADRDPTAEERAKIEQVLRDEGFTAWEEIEFDDDGVWEVDDAVAADGKEYDVKLDANFAVISREPD